MNGLDRPPDAAPLAGPHWEHSVRLYAMPGVSDACLLLQDRCGVDVNILLVAIFGAVELELGVNEHVIEAMDRRVRAWRDAAVVPLRTARRALKAIDAPGASGFRDAVKELEIHAEQIEQAWLAGCLCAVARRRERAEGAADVVRRVVRLLGRDGPDPDSGRAMDTIAHASLTMRAAAGGSLANTSAGRTPG